MKKLMISLPCAVLLLAGCGSEEKSREQAESAPTPKELIADKPVIHGDLITSVELTDPLNQEWVDKGKAIYEMKCLACHRLDETRLVGPGWKGITDKREPEWIMNMITNVDIMLETDEEAQKLLELCLVRMPNQNVSEPEARQILEFMRANDSGE